MVYSRIDILRQANLNWHTKLNEVTAISKLYATLRRHSEKDNLHIDIGNFILL